MTATYTNVISSLAIVPRVLPGKLTAQELLDQNYTAKYVDIQSYKVMNAMVVFTANIWTRSEQQRIAKLQKRLFESIKPKNLMPEPVSKSELVEFYGDKSMEIMDESTLNGWIQAMAGITGRDFYVCDEKLFQIQKYIYFDSLPNSDVAFETYKRLTDAGFVPYWRATAITHLERYLTLMPIQLAKDEGIYRPSKSVDGTLLDSLVLESFYVHWCMSLFLHLPLLLWSMPPFCHATDYNRWNSDWVFNSLVLLVRAFQAALYAFVPVVNFSTL